MWIMAIAVSFVGGGIDWRTRRLPNWLTAPGFVLGLAGNTWLFGWPGMRGAMLGAGIALVLLLPIVLLRGLGAGDWKLMGALGALVSSREILHLLFLTILVAGVIATVQIFRQGAARTTLKHLYQLVLGFFVFGLKPHPDLNIDNPAGQTFPFGVAAALATVLCYFLALHGV